MLEINGCHVVVFHVPSEHGPLTPEIQIGRIDSLQHHVADSVCQATVQSAEIPLACLFNIVEERAFDIRAVERRSLVQTAPEGTLQLADRESSRVGLCNFGFAGILLPAHGFLAGQFQFVNSWLFNY